MSGDDAWDQHARHWERHTIPQRPHPDDTAVVERVAAELARQRHPDPVAAVLLGVTPETAGCRWPVGTRLLAFDASPEMIRRLWPAPGTPADARAELGDWTDLPLGDATVDLVAADNSLCVVYWPQPAGLVLEEVRRTLRPEGRFVLRHPVLPERRETIEEIVADLHAGRIATPGVAKARMWAVLQRPGWQGMWSQELRDLWWKLFPDPEAIAAKLGWRPEVFAMERTIAASRVTTVVSRERLLEFIDPMFRVVEEAVGSYQLAERFPTLVLEPRK
jgi:SAM-dependent methyltransferase